MLNKEIIQRIQSAYSKGVSSDDSRLTRRAIYSKIKTLRIRLLVQELNKKKPLNIWNYQTIPCIELEEVAVHNCPCIVPDGCTILRSKHKLPRILSSLFGNAIKGVYSLARKEISPIEISAVEYLSAGRYTNNTPRYFLQDGYLYVVNSKLQVVTITAIFEEPLEAKNFPSVCPGQDCRDCNKCVDPLEQDFPLDGELVDVLVEMAKSELVNTYLQVPQDNRNNANDERLVKPENGE